MLCSNSGEYFGSAIIIGHACSSGGGWGCVGL